MPNPSISTALVIALTLPSLSLTQTCPNQARITALETGYYNATGTVELSWPQAFENNNADAPWHLSLHVNDTRTHINQGIATTGWDITSPRIDVSQSNCSLPLPPGARNLSATGREYNTFWVGGEYKGGGASPFQDVDWTLRVNDTYTYDLVVTQPVPMLVVSTFAQKRSEDLSIIDAVRVEAQMACVTPSDIVAGSRLPGGGVKQGEEGGGEGTGQGGDESAGVRLGQLHELRVMALGNAKILYGLERFKFFDIVVAYSEAEAKFATILVCSLNGFTKILRKEVASCPLAAARALVHGLHVDTGVLLTKYDVGDQMFGQQGSTRRGEVFSLDNCKGAVCTSRDYDQDDTSTLSRRTPNAPSGPRADYYPAKRTRYDVDRPVDGYVNRRDSDGFETEGRLNYED
ncbi:hypothetical protein E8E13_003131 [Curvularia kusanoi]|uniref:Uncharacterized protein n=1 Tax=Curvularia kusanoi TaxID=90978 RepID=A0A9P4W9W3_CURKU|nr:hypothetical protein E8E13_003131 [Curvularia kusanoi]